MIEASHSSCWRIPSQDLIHCRSSRLTSMSKLSELCAATLQSQLAYCAKNNWAGYDPYDALNSEFFKALPLLNRRLPRIFLTQVVKRSPINVRKLLRIPKTQDPKALAL